MPQSEFNLRVATPESYMVHLLMDLEIKSKISIKNHGISAINIVIKNGKIAWKDWSYC